MADEKEPSKDSNKPVHQTPRLRTVAGGLAVMFLEDTVREGKEVEIPSLGITIGKEDLVQHENNHKEGEY